MRKAPAPTIVPGILRSPTPPLQRYRSPEPQSALSHAVSELTEPGDLLLHVAASTSTYVREAVNAGRRILSINVNPIPLIWMNLQLAHPPKAKLSALLTRLGDIPKEGRPFVRYVEDVYQSRCPQCGRIGTAEWFIWDRETNRLSVKRVRCPHCQESCEGPVTEEDIANSERFPPGSGPAYYMALGRAANPDDPNRKRAAELIELYTPRNLSLLFDVINRWQRLDLPDHLKTSLTALILEAMDKGSRLVASADPGVRPRSLRPARYYREYNVWLLLETALEAIDKYPDPLPVRASTVTDLLASREPGFTLSSSSLHTLIRSEPTRRFDALILEIQPPDAVFWALSALWSVWLWRDTVSSSVKTFLSRRRLTWDWYARSLSVGLIQAKQLLRTQAPTFCILHKDSIPAAQALNEAMQHADYHVRTWVGDPDAGYYGLLKAEGVPGNRRLQSLEACEAMIRQRGEPTSVDHLAFATLLLSGGQPIDVKDLERDSRWREIEEGRWWISGLSDSETPLADRVECAVIEMLNIQPTWQRSAIIYEIYRRFNGVSSPEMALVEACLDAYTEAHAEIPSNRITVRDEDDPQKRKREIETLRNRLKALGNRLGYQIDRTELDDILWIQHGDIHYLFRCIATAVLTPHLSNPPTGAGQHCLVLPGGRAALIHLKLKRDPRLSQWLDLHRWKFIKYRHLRRMVREVKSRSDIEVFLGLDPIVEQGQAQIPLPLEVPAIISESRHDWGRSSHDNPGSTS